MNIHERTVRLPSHQTASLTQQQLLQAQQKSQRLQIQLAPTVSVCLQFHQTTSLTPSRPNKPNLSNSSPAPRWYVSRSIQRRR